MILAFLVSCRATKDIKAVERVTASRTLLNRVKPAVDSLWPAVCDTSTKFRPGRIDSILYSVYVPMLVDTTNRKRLLDSLVGSDGICWESGKVAYNLGFQDAKKLMKDVKIPKPAPDTVDNTVVNRRGLEIANDARKTAEFKVASLQATADGFKKERNVLFWIVLGLTAGLGAIVFAKWKSRLP